MLIQKRKFLFPLLLIFLLFSLACATSIPFLGTAEDEADSVPDAQALETMIAKAALQKVMQTLEARPPTMTPTPLPTGTATAPPTATELPPTSTPTAYPKIGTELEENDDGSSTYFDYTGGYKIDTPANWLALRPGEREYTAAWLIPEAANDEVKNSLQKMQSRDPNTYRLSVLDIQDGHYQNGFLSNINLIASIEEEVSLEVYFAQNVLELPEVFPDIIILSSDLSLTSTGIPVGIIETQWSLEDISGTIFNLYQKQAIFKAKNRYYILTFTSTDEFKSTIVKDFNLLVDSFMLLE